MQRHLDQDLLVLKEKLLTMASFAETAVVQAMRALEQKEEALALQVENADTTLDQFEIEVDELCISLLALKAPISSDLRLITVAMKINQNLERVGDEAVKIAKRAIAISHIESPQTTLLEIPHLSSIVIDSLRSSLDAFVKADTALARDTILRDTEIDNLNKRIQHKLADIMVNAPHTIRYCLHLMIVAKSLERIADHATNIAEETVFLYEGKDIRHIPREQNLPL